MVLDKILERKDGTPYNPKKFYNDIASYGDIGFEIANALDSGTEIDVRSALCNYITNNEYNPTICDYIKSINWIQPCKK